MAEAVSERGELSPGIFVAEVAKGRPRDDYRLPPEQLREFTRFDKSKTVLHIGGEWLVILGCAALCEAYFSAPAFFAACVVIGSRLHALGILAHDGTHGLLWPKRRINDLLVECLLAWPVFLSLPAYRAMHVRHHRYLNTLDDPDFARNRPDRLRSRRSVWEFIRIMGGLYGEQRQMVRFVADSHKGDASPSNRPLVPRWLVYGGVVGGAALGGGLPLLLKYWIAPFASWFLLSMRLKGTSEHFAVEDEEACNAARTIRANLFTRLFVAPKNVHYHIEHHLYPSVPFHRLPQLHAALLTHEGFRQRAHLTSSYRSFLVECLSFRQRSPRPAMAGASEAVTLDDNAQAPPAHCLTVDR